MTVAEILVRVLGCDNNSSIPITPENAKEIAFEIANDKFALIEVLNQMSPEMIRKLKTFYTQEYKQD